MKSILRLIVLVCLFHKGYSQPAYNITESPYLAAVSCTPAYTDVFSCAVNPAALPLLKGFSMGAYFEKKYLVEGLSFAETAIAYGKKSGGVAVSFRYFGNPAYHEFHAAAEYGKNLGQVNLGASFNYHVYSITGFYKVEVANLGLYSVWKLSDKLFTTFGLINPPFGRLNNQALKQAAEYHLGWNYESSSDVCLSIDLKKTEDIPLEVNGLVQYRFNEKFYAKAGFSSSGPQPFIGLGCRWKDFLAEFSISYHPSLGSTPGVLFSYEKTGGAALQ